METKKTAEEILEDVEDVKEAFLNMARLEREARRDLKASGQLDDFRYGRLSALESAYKLAAEELGAILGRAAV